MDDLSEISDKFDDVKNIREKILINFNEINAKISSLKLIYKDVSEKHCQPECTLGVDSLYFQNELISREHKNLEQLFDFINNRIYCEYYKLNNMILSYIKNELRSPELIKKTKTETVYPPYKSLDPLKVYDFSLVNQLFNQISDILNKMHSHTKNQDDNLIIDQGRMEMGLNIDNVIHSQTYVNTILREKGKMFKSYLSAFQRHHLKYLKRLEAKVKLVLSIIHDDINIGSKSSKSSTKKNTSKKTSEQDQSSSQNDDTERQQEPEPNQQKSAQENSKPSSKQEESDESQETKQKQEQEQKQDTTQHEKTKQKQEQEKKSTQIVKEIIHEVVSKIEKDQDNIKDKPKNNIEVVISE